MSDHSHDDHHVTESKPVSFTVPLILGSVTVLIIVLLLSVCDPKPHGEHHGEENAAHAKFEGHSENPNAGQGQQDTKDDHGQLTTTDIDSTSKSVEHMNTVEGHH